MGQRWARLRPWGVVLGAAVLVSAASWSYARAAPTYLSATRQPHVIFRIHSARINESSSLVVSTAHPRLVYTANDSGDGPFVYVLDHHGRLVGTTTLAGVDPVDVEAMSSGSDGSLVVADIGDNHAVRGSVQIYRIPQPKAGDFTVTPEKVTLTYPDGPHNAESVLYDARTGRVFVVSKEVDAHVYATGPDVFSAPTAALTRVAAAPTIATDAAFLPGARAVVVRTYYNAVVYRYPSWHVQTSFTLPTEQQGESISAVPGQTSVWVGSEGVDSPVWDVPLDKAAAALVEKTGQAPRVPHTAPATSPTPPTAVHQGEHGPKTTAQDHGPSGWVVALGGVGTAVLVVVVAAVSTRRRSRRPSPPAEPSPPAAGVP
jgi:hypothetical protein